MATDGSACCVSRLRQLQGIGYVNDGAFWWLELHVRDGSKNAARERVRIRRFVRELRHGSRLIDHEMEEDSDGFVGDGLRVGRFLVAITDGGIGLAHGSGYTRRVELAADRNGARLHSGRALGLGGRR